MRKINLMIVNSEPFFRAGLRQALAGGSNLDSVDIIECDPGENGSEAITQIAAASPDIVLLDIGFPFLEGVELCKQIVRTFPQTRVVVLSSNPVEDDNELLEAIKVGAAAYLRSTQHSSEELTDIIARTARGDYPINDCMSTRPKVAWRVLKQFQEMATSVRRKDDIVAPLTDRELQILMLIAEGNSNKCIARTLSVSEQTIKNYVSAILRKLSANDRAHAVMLAVRSGIVLAQTASTKGRRREDSLQALISSIPHPN